MTMRRLGLVLEQTDIRGSVDLSLLGVSVASGVRVRTANDGRPAPSLDLSGYKRVEPGDIVMNALGKPHGSIGRSPVSGITSPAYWVLRCREGFDSRFAHHLLRSHWAVQRFAGLGKNLPPNQFDIPWETFRAIEAWFPSNQEQRRIADFLDDRVARIDQIITARQAQSQLLSDLATARLQDLQDRWTEQFGETRLARVLVGLEQGWSPQAEAIEAGPDEWGVMRAGCVNDGVFRESDNKRLPDHLEPERRYELRGGDLLMSRASGSLDKIGSAAVVPEGVRRRLILCDKVYRLTLESGWHPRFVAPMLRTHKSRAMIRLGVSGAEGMANNLPSGVVRGLMVPLVPCEQQVSGIEELALIEGEALTARSRLERSCALLTEYKQSLITAAVTGELDATTAGSGIPG